ncbi:MAG: AFG1 family ATPase, partial [Gammaproteobacteria bacterium]|nr:AFG1 family ATPase [Gammaproteobacteria bacterium]
ERKSAFGRLQQLKRRLGFRDVERTPVRGLYLWGGVGRGKTWLMDLFFDCLPFEDKRRRHFHRFMQAVHHELARLDDQADPLEAVASRIAAETRIVCFDEFHVSDIADAMLLGTLFDALFRRGVTLVATSNMPPEDLYKDGLQRQRFLPAIADIQAHTTTLHLTGTDDYRFRVLEKAEIYHSPLDVLADAGLEDAFERIAPEPGKRDHALEIEGRAIPARRRADGVVWFEFAHLCGGPRGPADYIEIARCFQTVLVSNIPLLDETRDNEARRFITLVDEFYDRNVKLIVSAAAPAAELYRGERLGFEYRRTLSRLQEMQSRDYLARPHLP